MHLTEKGKSPVWPDGRRERRTTEPSSPRDDVTHSPSAAPHSLHHARGGGEDGLGGAGQPAADFARAVLVHSLSHSFAHSLIRSVGRDPRLACKVGEGVVPE